MTDAVRLHNVSRQYIAGDRPAVYGLSLTVGDGELFVLLGPSGCGKTTTLRLIGGFERPDAGEVVLYDRLVAGSGVWLPPEKRGIGMVFQDYALFPHLSVADNVAFGLTKMPKDARRARTREALKLVELLDYANRYPHELSGGQQQRVAIARALAPQPRLLILDEPFSNLDADLRHQMRGDLVDILRRSGLTAILVTHDQQDAFAVADRIAVLNHGRLEQVGSPDELYTQPRSRFVGGFVGQANFLPGRAAGKLVDTELGPLLALDDPGATAVEVLLRPEDLVLGLARDGQGAIDERVFRGADTLYRVRLRSGAVVRVTQVGGRPLPVGAQVHVHVRPAAAPAFAVATTSASQDFALSGDR